MKAFRRATIRLGGLVVAADVNSLAAALYEADSRRLIPRSSDPEFIDAVLALCRREAIGLVVPTRDEELSVFAAARERFLRDGTLVLVSSPDAIETCGDKARFAAAVAAAGLQLPRTFARGEAIEFPAFVKPRRGKGGRGARIVRSPEELEDALRDAGSDAIVQEFVEAPEFTIDTFLDLEGRPISCVPRERLQVVAGESVVTRTVRDPELVSATLRLCTSIGLIGHVTVQAFRSTGWVKFIEINPRFGGAANLGFEAGARTPELAVRLARGERLDPQLEDYEAGLTMLRSPNDRFVRDAQLLQPAATDDTGAREPVLPIPARSANLSAVLFDLDDTLYPEHQFVDGGFRAVARLLDDSGGHAIEAITDRLWALHARDGRGHLFDALLSELGRTPDPDLVLACLLSYRDHDPRLSPFDEIETLIDEIHLGGARVGVVSDGQSGVQHRKLAALGTLAGRFDVVVMTDELGPGHAKPSPASFRVACRLLNVEAARAVYVANDPRKDFRGARSAGLRTVRFGIPPDEGGGVDTAAGADDDSDDQATSVAELRWLLLGGEIRPLEVLRP